MAVTDSKALDSIAVDNVNTFCVGHINYSKTRLDHMSGPIVRTGTTPAFWKNWDQAFSGKATGGAVKKKASGGETKAVNAFAAKKATKKAAKKVAGKAAAKKKK